MISQFVIRVKGIRCCGPARSIAVGFALTLLGLAATGSGSAGTADTAEVTLSSKVPQPLVGTWRRNVTAADFERAGASTYAVFAGPSSIVVNRSGEVGVNLPGSVADFVTRFSVLAGGRLIRGSNPECPASKGLYRWKVAGRLLTLTKLRDRCSPIAAIFAGVWKKK